MKIKVDNISEGVDGCFILQKTNFFLKLEAFKTC